MSLPLALERRDVPVGVEGGKFDERSRTAMRTAMRRDARVLGSGLAARNQNKSSGFPVGNFSGERNREGAVLHEECKSSSSLSLHLTTNEDGCIS